MTFFNIDGSKASFNRKASYKEFEGEIKLPDRLEEMIKVSKVLSSGFPFVRVDFFEIDGEIVFSEMTFTPGGGFMSIQPEEFNDKWGNMINLRNLL